MPVCPKCKRVIDNVYLAKRNQKKGTITLGCPRCGAVIVEYRTDRETVRAS